MTVSRRPFVKRLMLHVALLPFLIFALFPFYHMTLTSLKQDRELYDRYAVPLVITQGPTLEHYVKLLWDTEFLTWTKNSLMVTFLATGISVVIGTIAAYALARLKFFGVASLGTGIFITYLVPTSLLFLPLAQVVQWLGLSDSKWALVLTYPTFLVPFCTWLLIAYFRTVPKEVEECAMVDGATRIQALWRIALPMAVPGLGAAGVAQGGGPLRVGDRIRIRGHTTDLLQAVESLQLEHRPVQLAERGSAVALKVRERVRKHDAVLRLTGD